MTQASAASTVKLLGMHHSGIPVNDLDRAVEFYTRVLGMELLGITKASDGAGHFLGGNTPAEVVFENPEAAKDFREYVQDYQKARPGRSPSTKFARLRAGRDEVVLFLRTEPVEIDTLVENGIFHQSFHVSVEDMDHLLDLKAEGGSGINFHTGPVLRWPHGRALYVWDTEGNYIELESEEDLPTKFGVSK